MIIASYKDSYLYKDPYENIEYEGNLEDIAWALYNKYGSSLREDETNITFLRVPECDIIILKNHFINKQFLSYYIGVGKGKLKPLFFDDLNKEYEKIYSRFCKLKTFW